MEDWQRTILTLSGDRLKKLEEQIEYEVHMLSQRITDGLEEDSCLLDDLSEILAFIKQSYNPAHTQVFLMSLNLARPPNLTSFSNHSPLGVVKWRKADTTPRLTGP